MKDAVAKLLLTDSHAPALNAGDIGKMKKVTTGSMQNIGEIYKKMILSLDAETTKLPYSFPWQKQASLVCVSYTTDQLKQGTFWFNHNHHPCDPLAENVAHLQAIIDEASVVVGHNIKFDLHWFRYIGLDFSSVSVWDTMVAEYMLRNHRTEESLSLAEVAAKRGCTAKLDVVKQMWDEGYETEDIPADILDEYCKGDTLTALEIYQQQVVEMKESGKLMPFYLDMATLKLLEEAEYNGMKLDVDKLEHFKVQYTKELEELDVYLIDALGIDNPGSSSQLSCGLFGGTYCVEGRVPGKRPGTTKKGKIPKEIAGVGFKPIAGTEGAKEGIYSTDKTVLMQLKAKTRQQKEILAALEKRSAASQMLSTFVKGLLERQDESIVHHNLNQSVTVTGRLSSSNPNLQNIPRGNTAPIKEAFISRYGESI